MPKLSPEREQAVEERRWKVWRLRVVRKLDICEIVKLVGLSRRTVASDLAEMRGVRDEHIRLSRAEQQATIDAAIEVAEQCDAVCRQAWADLDAAEKGSFARAKFLNSILNAVRWKIEILQSVGLLPTAADELILTEGGSLRDLDDQQLGVLIALMKGLIERGKSLDDFLRAMDRMDREDRRRAARQKVRGDKTT